MVTTLACLGVEVTVTSGGPLNTLKEYDDDEPDRKHGRNSVSRYIECRPGQVFEIRVKVSAGTRCTRSHFHFNFHVDGNYVHSNSISAETVAGDDQEIVSRGARSARGGGNDAYCFTNLDIDSELPQSDNGGNPDLGTIVIKLLQDDEGVKQVQGPRVPRTASTVLGYHTGSIPEKDVKGRAISQGVTFLSARTGGAAPAERTVTDYWPPVQEPPGAAPPRMVPCSINRDKKKTFTFVFKYRTLADLKSLLVVPRSPSPRPITRKFKREREGDNSLRPRKMLRTDEDGNFIDAAGKVVEVIEID